MIRSMSWDSQKGYHERKPVVSPTLSWQKCYYPLRVLMAAGISVDVIYVCVCHTESAKPCNSQICYFDVNIMTNEASKSLTEIMEKY